MEFDCISSLSLPFYLLGTKLYRHIVGIPVGSNCAYLAADLFFL